MSQVCSNGTRVAKCMKDFFIHKKNYKGYLNASVLAKSLHQKLWDDSSYLLKQLPGIGVVTAKVSISSLTYNFYYILFSYSTKCFFCLMEKMFCLILQKFPIIC